MTKIKEKNYKIPEGCRFYQPRFETGESLYEAGRFLPKAFRLLVDQNQIRSYPKSPSNKDYTDMEN